MELGIHTMLCSSMLYHVKNYTNPAQSLQSARTKNGHVVMLKLWSARDSWIDLVQMQHISSYVYDFDPAGKQGPDI
jgi:hypothetical protein